MTTQQRRPQGLPGGGANGLDAGGVDVSDGSTDGRQNPLSPGLASLLERVAEPDPMDRIVELVDTLVALADDLLGLIDAMKVPDGSPLDTACWRIVWVAEDLVDAVPVSRP